MHLRQRFYYFAVVMKSGLYISLLLYCMLGLTACTGPVILDEEEKTESNSEQDNETNTRDSVAIIHEGSYASPYSIAEAQTLGRGKSVWVEGYIVGSVSGSMKNGCNYTHETSTASNILLSDTILEGREEDYLYCMPVNLPNGSIERDDLNLYDNPQNHHQKVRIQGDITQYFKVAGIKNITDYIFCDDIGSKDEEEKNEDSFENEEDESEEPEILDTPNDPDKTNTDTLSIAEGIKLQNEDFYTQACIRGYIVGYAQGNKSVIYMDSTTTITEKAYENVVLADNKNERDYTKVIVVALPKGYIRDDVNLADNPQNLHKRLTVIGYMLPYYGLAGCKETLGAENRARFLLE